MIYNILLSIYIGTILGHSNLYDPKPRGNLKWWGYCSRGQGCSSVCDAPSKDSLILSNYYTEKKYVKRGERITVKWNRQNHPGGFVRLAFTQLEKSDIKENFDSNVAKYVCYETNCGETESNEYLGYLNGVGSTMCSTDVIIPQNLRNGPISLQWLWFGGGIYYGEQNTTFANYVNCGDMILEGGLPYHPNKPTFAKFQGGDVANIGLNQCRYWGSNKPGECVNGSEKREECGFSEPKNGKPYGFY